MCVSYAKLIVQMVYKGPLLFITLDPATLADAVHHYIFTIVMCNVCANGKYTYTGCTKKMYHSDLYPISVLVVGFYFFTYVLESEF